MSLKRHFRAERADKNYVMEHAKQIATQDISIGACQKAIRRGIGMPAKVLITCAGLLFGTTSAQAAEGATGFYLLGSKG
ncbi:MAG: hypothetical protein ABL907_07080 [Hyphomicrobium sp.]